MLVDSSALTAYSYLPFRTPFRRYSSIVADILARCDFCEMGLTEHTTAFTVAPPSRIVAPPEMAGPTPQTETEIANMIIELGKVTEETKGQPGPSNENGGGSPSLHT